MTKLTDKAVEALRNLPDPLQDDLARMVLDLVSDAPLALTLDEAAAIAEAEAELARGERVSIADLGAFWSRHGV